MIKQLVKPAIAKIPPYVAGKTVAQAQAQQGGRPMIKLGSNENQYGPSPLAVRAMAEAAAASSVYPDPQAADLKEKLAAYYGISEDHFIAGNGSSTILDVIGSVFINPGDETVFCIPTFMLYHSITTANEGVPVMLPLTGEMVYDLDAMEKAITKKTKLVMICNPNNPTGTHVDGDKLEAFIRRLPDHVICLIDEAYIEYADDPSCRSMIGLVDECQLIVLRTFSKLWGLAGARAGYAIASPEIIQYLSAKIMTFNLNRMVIAGAMASLDDRDYFRMSYEGNREGRTYLTRELMALGYKVYPSQSNFLYVDAGTDPKYMAAEMEKRGIIVRGNFQAMRITVGTQEQNEAVVKALQDIENLLDGADMVSGR